MTPEYVSLHNHTHDSILDGYSKPSEYISRAVELGHKGIGLTDHGNLFGTFSFLQETRKAGIVGVPGCEFYVAPINPDGARHIGPVFYGPGGKKSQNDVASNGAYLHLSVWAYNNVGLHNLFMLSTLSNDPSRFYKKPRTDFEMLSQFSEGLIVSTGCPSSEISTRFLLGQDDKAYSYARQLKEVFGSRLYVEVMDHHMNIDLERTLLPKQLKMSKDLGIPLLATNDCHYAHQDDSVPHEEMLCIQSGSRMDDLPYDEGGSRFAFNGNEYYLKTADEMSASFPADDFPNALRNTLEISEMASDVTLDFDPHLKPKPVIPEGFDSALSYYKHLINEGFKKRYGGAPKEIREEALRRNKTEFDVIYSSDFIGYMLVVRDYLVWTKDHYSTTDDSGTILALPTGVGRGCFLPDTKVSLYNHTKKIQEISTSSRRGNPTTALTHDGTFKKVEQVFEYSVQDEDCVELSLSNGETIRCTADHRIFKKDDGFVAASEIAQGDILLGAKKSHDRVVGKCDSKNKNMDFVIWTEKTLFNENDSLHNEIVVNSVRHFKYTGKVYDLQIADVHNYTVGGVTVHNSVGGSISAYELGISEIDPIKYDLFFERFLSAGRGATYRLTYDDGTTEDIVVSGEKTLSRTGENVYIHQLNVGDEVEDDTDGDDKENKDD